MKKNKENGGNVSKIKKSLAMCIAVFCALSSMTLTLAAPASDKDVEVTATSDPTNDVQTITWDAGAQVDHIILPNGNISKDAQGAYSVMLNGSYKFVGVLADGTEVTKVINVDSIDRRSPTLILSSVMQADKVEFQVEAIDTDSGIDKLIMPDGTEVQAADMPASYTYDKTDPVTFRAVDQAGNMISRTVIRGEETLIGSTKPTAYMVEGIPAEWTNAVANIKVSALHEDGVYVTMATNVSNPSSKVKPGVQTSSKEFKNNGTVTIHLYDGEGNSSDVPISLDGFDFNVISKLDTDFPTASFTTSGKSVIMTASDDASGIRHIILPDGSHQEVNGNKTATASYELAYTGTYQFVVEDEAGNVANFNFEVTGLPNPPTPIAPPAVSDGSAEQEVEVLGTVNPVESNPDTMLKLVIPTSLDFLIDGDRNFIAGSYPFENTGDLDASIVIKETTPMTGTVTQLVAPDSYTDTQWAELSQSDSKSKMALSLGDVSLHNAGAKLLDLNSGAKEVLKLTGKYGKDWGNADDLTLKYNLTLEITAKN